MKFKNENRELTIALSGHIDSSNASATENEINEIRAAHEHDRIVLDMETLDYISSAGLRILLRLRKEYGALELINVSQDVYEILDMTGFAEMMTVRKAYRVLSIEGCEMIGQGSNGKVYRLDPDTIVKVYNNPDSLPEIHRERELARKAFVLGIPTAIPYDVVRVGASYGSVFELLNATSFSKLIRADREKMDDYLKIFVEVVKKLHSTEVKPDEVPDFKALVVSWAEYLESYLPAEAYEKLTALIQAVPERSTLIHGDYHTNNLMMQGNESLLIDMDTLSHGHPIFELGCMYLALVGFGELDHSITQNFLGLDYETTCLMWKKILALYMDTQDEAVLSKVENAACLIANVRLMRRTIKRIGFDDPQGAKIIAASKQHILDMIDSLDRLDLC